MGAADVVPGVSGGTIAFITGIYQRMLTAIAAFDYRLISEFRKGGIKAVWQRIDGNFLTALLAGILFSVVMLARVIHSALESHPAIVWSLFLGLVIASVPFMWSQLRQPRKTELLLLGLGCFVAYSISIAKPMALPDHSWVIFLCASVAICATILPGISGSFLLLILGIYPVVIQALGYGDMRIILSFGAGVIFGLMTFVKLVAWVYERHHDRVLALLTGFLIGSLNTLWPWKQPLETMIKPSGEVVVLVQKNVSPWDYSQALNLPNYFYESLAACTIGIVLVILMGRVVKTDN